MAYADIMAKVSYCRLFWLWVEVWYVHNVLWNAHIFLFSFLPSIYVELPYWWGRRRRRGNSGKTWGWDVLWGATVRTGNGRPGARDQEHSGAVALNALSDLIIGTLLHNHIHLSLSLSSVFLCLVSFPLSVWCMICLFCVHVVLASLWVAWFRNWSSNPESITKYPNLLTTLEKTWNKKWYCTILPSTSII